MTIERDARLREVQNWGDFFRFTIDAPTLGSRREAGPVRHGQGLRRRLSPPPPAPGHPRRGPGRHRALLQGRRARHGAPRAEEAGRPAGHHRPAGQGFHRGRGATRKARLPRRRRPGHRPALLPGPRARRGRRSSRRLLRRAGRPPTSRSATGSGRPASSSSRRPTTAASASPGSSPSSPAASSPRTSRPSSTPAARTR